MWHWDQGHGPYFWFDSLRRLSQYVVAHNFKAASREELLDATGLSFAAPVTHSPWRQYSRALKLTFLVSEDQGKAVPTPVAQLLSVPGRTTCDQYMHFLARAFTEPSPALQEWVPNTNFRYPLLFTLKYVLTKRSVSRDPVSTLDEIIGAFLQSGFVGDEPEEAFIGIVGPATGYANQINRVPENLRRQARESLGVLAQISYLHLGNSRLTVSLDAEDAATVFADLHPVLGPHAADRETEIRRVATLFRDGATEDFYDYPNTAASDVVQSGFMEGNKVEKTHLTIERNQSLRRAFFMAHNTAFCDVCSLNTVLTYPWTDRVLDLHHLLPLCSGMRVTTIGTKTGTTLDDLVPVCPSCHRAIHRFYGRWLKQKGLLDFENEGQARTVYRDMKAQFHGAVHA